MLADALDDSWPRSTLPPPLIPALARDSVIDCAPAGPVAVPTTVAPRRPSSSAIALLEELAEQAGLQNQSDQVAEVFRVLDDLSETDRKLSEAA